MFFKSLYGYIFYCEIGYEWKFYCKFIKKYGKCRVLVILKVVKYFENVNINLLWFFEYWIVLNGLDMWILIYVIKIFDCVDIFKYLWKKLLDIFMIEYCFIF